MKTENLIPFTPESFERKKSTDENMLGDLLFYLRSEKVMSTLMVCRQIDTIEVVDGFAILNSEKEDLTELVQNEKHKTQLDLFFKQRGLGFKLKEKIKQDDPVETLREFFGDKLIVK